MNLHIRKFLTFAPALVLLAATTAFADGVVTLSPGPVGSGQIFTVAVNITGPTVKDVPSGVSDVYAFELDLSFPSDLVQARQVNDGTFLPGVGTTYFSRGTIDNGTGTVSHIFGTLVSAATGASGSGTLVNIKFQGIAAGTPEIALTKITLLDSHLNPIVVDDTPAQVTTTVSLNTAEVRSPDVLNSLPGAQPLIIQAGTASVALDKSAERLRHGLAALTVVGSNLTPFSRSKSVFKPQLSAGGWFRGRSEANHKSI
jgi:hypothetical protein